MAKKHLVVYFTKTSTQNGDVTYITKTSSSNSVEIIELKGINILPLSDPGRDAVVSAISRVLRAGMQELPIKAGEKFEYKMLFNTEYSFSGKATRIQAVRNYKLDDDAKLYVPMNEKEIHYFANIIRNLKAF